MSVDEHRWVALAGLTILGMVCALAMAGVALRDGGDGVGWGGVAVFVVVAATCLRASVHVYRGRR